MNREEFQSIPQRGCFTGLSPMRCGGPRWTASGLLLLSNVNASYAGDLVLQFPVPEPSVVALVAIGVIGSAIRRRRPTLHNRV